jgi:hypothetical protein
MVSPVQLAGEHVPLLLQVIMVLWDHYTPVVQDQAREMLVHLIHELVISKIEDGTTDIDKRSIEEFIESIRRHDTKIAWNYDDKNGKDAEGSGSKVPESMTYVAAEVLKFFSLAYPGLREAWGKVALNWATSCPVRHLACRSFQLFRCILSSLDQQMLSDMLARLSNTISDDESDIQTFSMEILTTLRAIIEALQPEDLIQYPQLFWTTCACLDTIHEGEFMESMLMLDRLMDKINLGDPAVIRILEDHCPEKWEGQFEGLSQLIYKGVRSSMCIDRSLRLLERLVVLPSSRVVGDETRLLYTTLANLPRFLQSFDQGRREPSVSDSAEILAQVAENYQFGELAETLISFARIGHRPDMDSLTAGIIAFRAESLPELEIGSLIFLLGLLANKHDWVKINTMEVLRYLIKKIDMRKPEIANKGPDLISPLLRLLQTELCPQALTVLDSVMGIQTAAMPQPVERAHLRMSMAGSHTSRNFKKQYEKTQSIYGIPEETGWSIPMPAHHSHLTRANVHAVFYTCSTVENADAAQVETPQIEFRQEEFPFNPISDYGRTATMTSEDTRGESHIGELVMKLDSLDDFFEDDDDAETLTDLPNSSVFGNSRYPSTAYSNGSLDTRETLYDQQTAPILHKSLAHNPSVSFNSGFNSGFSDVKLSPARDPGVMNPGAFNTLTSGQPPGPLQPPSRPGLHSRSVTSPSHPSHNQPQRLSPSLSSTLDEHDEPFSDDDVASSRSPYPLTNADRTFSLENMVTGLRHDTKSRIRSGMRRLTGNSGDREREKVKMSLQMQRSPQVPKVPDIYLSGGGGGGMAGNPKSSEL